MTLSTAVRVSRAGSIYPCQAVSISTVDSSQCLQFSWYHYQGAAPALLLCPSVVIITSYIPPPAPLAPLAPLSPAPPHWPVVTRCAGTARVLTKRQSICNLLHSALQSYRQSLQLECCCCHPELQYCSAAVHDVAGGHYDNLVICRVRRVSCPLGTITHSDTVPLSLLLLTLMWLAKILKAAHWL